MMDRRRPSVTFAREKIGMRRCVPRRGGSEMFNTAALAVWMPQGAISVSMGVVESRKSESQTCVWGRCRAARSRAERWEGGGGVGERDCVVEAAECAECWSMASSCMALWPWQHGRMRKRSGEAGEVMEVAL